MAELKNVILADLAGVSVDPVSALIWAAVGVLAALLFLYSVSRTVRTVLRQTSGTARPLMIGAICRIGGVVGLSLIAVQSGYIQVLVFLAAFTVTRLIGTRWPGGRAVEAMH
jgi:hypothetical protein